MRRTLAISAALLFVVAYSSGDATGRGFGGGFHGGGGGFHGGGGFGGGGFGGGMPGGFGGGGFGGGARPDGFGGGGLPGGYGGGFARPDGFGGGLPGGYGGGARPDGFGGYAGGIARPDGFGGFTGGGARPNGFGGFNGAGGFGQGGAAPTRSGLNSFLGLPSDAGMNAVSNSHTFGNYTVDHGSVEGPRGGEAAGTAITGPDGGTVARGGAVGPNGGAVAGRGVEGPNGAGFAQGAAVGPRGTVAGGSVARGPDGGVAARGAAVGPHGAAAGFGYVTPSSRYATGAYVRRGFNDWGIYSPGWYTNHPGAWYAAGLTAGAWAAASWDSLDGWFGTTMAPDYYDYGNDIVYQNDNVYVNGQDAGTADQYYQQASDLASTGSQTQTGDDQQWLPLGVFAMTHSDQANANSNLVIQLAVDKQGTIRGNYTDTKTNDTLPVQGAVDMKTQRAAWTIGTNTKDVIETGLYNLTKDEAPILVHFGQDRTEQWLLVRIKQDDQAAAPAAEQTSQQ